MSRRKRDPVREDRIHNEAIVDAGPEEQALSWYYYLEGKISFPFKARCLAAKVVSPLKKGETVEVIRMAPDDVCEHDMLVLVRWQGRKVAVPLWPDRSRWKAQERYRATRDGETLVQWRSILPLSPYSAPSAAEQVQAENALSAGRFSGPTAGAIACKEQAKNRYPGDCS